jgi:ATP-dependent Lon protease
MKEESKMNKNKEGLPDIPKVLPVIPLREIVIFPLMIVPLVVSREKSVKAVDQALAQQRMILLLTQKEGQTEDPKIEDIYHTGTVALVVKMLKLPDGKMRVLAQGIARAKVEKFLSTDPFLQAQINLINDKQVDSDSTELVALVRTVKESMEKSISLGKSIPPEIMLAAASIDDPGRLADLVISYLDIKTAQAQEILEEDDPINRLKKAYELLNKELEVLTVQQQISAQAKEEIDKRQKEFLLRQQLKAIQDQLGEGDELSEELKQFQEKIKKLKVPQEVIEEVDRNINRLKKMHPESAEAATLRNYLDLVTNLPWNKKTKDNLDVKKAMQILDEDHYDLEKIKDRIIEYLSVRKLQKGKMKGPILCFVGPPGVGKTSLGKSIARALKRKFVRISLGGVRDEAEIRGHRRTYVGAMPGRIIQSIIQAGYSNPVFMMDEVDKIGADFRGDPSAALLEVLDPEQNHSFRDNYLGVPFDLSDVMFITTANLLDPILPPFRDRMEILFLPGYTEEEKLHISRKYLVPKQLKENGLKGKDIKFSDNAIRAIISQYTREAGVRNLEREIASVCRKIARKIAEGKKGPFVISRETICKYLGAPKIFPDKQLERDRIGISTGLAWTATGGEILFIEALTMKGKGNLTLTGSLGDVMKESAQAALSYARSRADELGIDENFFRTHDIHIHVPEGATPKDGPSAGISMAAAMISAFTNKPVKKDIAMTGEITLRGNVLPIGGVKQKVLAASRANINKVILPKLNEKDLQEIPAKLRRKMEFILVEHVSQVIDACLWKEPLSSRKTA